MYRYLWKTACSWIDFPFLLTLSLGCCLIFLISLDKFRLVMLINDFPIKKHVNCNFKPGQRSFLLNKTIRFVLRLYMSSA